MIKRLKKIVSRFIVRLVVDDYRNNGEMRNIIVGMDR